MRVLLLRESLIWAGAGVCFALTNVLIRRTARIEIEQRVMGEFLVVIAVAPVAARLRGESPLQQSAAIGAGSWLLLALIGGTPPRVYRWKSPAASGW